MNRQAEVAPQQDHYDTEIDAIKRPVMLVGTVGVGATALLLLTIGLITGNGDMTVGALGPAIVGVLFGWQAFTAAQRVPLAVSLSVVTLIVVHGTVGQEKLLIPVALAAVIISGVGVLFTRNRVIPYFIMQSLILATGAVVWGDSATDRAGLIGTMLSSFSVLAYIMFSMRRSSIEAAKRYTDLFEDSPVALLEEDWSETRKATVELGIADPDELRRHLEENPALVVDLVSRARITKVNTAAVRLAQVAGSADLLGPMRASRVHETSLPGFVDQIVAVFERRTSLESRYETTSYRGEPIWVSARWIRPAQARTNQDVIVIAVNDVTLEVRARHNLESSMRSKDEFIASVSHELRTPLTVVVGLAGELSQNADQLGEAESTELLELIAGQSREMAFIVEDLLVAARADMDQIIVTPERVDVAANISKIISEFGWKASIELPEDDCEVLADPFRFRQIIRNLITNAHRYGGSRRRIVCDIGPHVSIEVRDDGLELREAERDRIFAHQRHAALQFEPAFRYHRREDDIAAEGQEVVSDNANTVIILNLSTIVEAHYYVHTIIGTADKYSHAGKPGFAMDGGLSCNDMAKVLAA